MTIKNRIQESVDLKLQILNNAELIEKIQQAADIVIKSYKSGGKSLFCGNGGSAADAQHLASELSGKFYINRPPIPAEACHVNSSFITAYSNDFNFENAYARYIEAIGKSNDVLFAISTSGNSKNVVNAAKKAKELGLTTIAMTGSEGGILKNYADVLINIPSTNTPRIQEAHILVGHIICEITEYELFSENS